jgi:hypothetical protein
MTENKYTLDELESMSQEAKAPMETVVIVLRIREKHVAQAIAARRSSLEEIEAINSNVERIFGANPEVSTKDLVREIGLPLKQGNLARASRKLAQLRLAHAAE